MPVKFIHTADIHIGMKFSDTCLDPETAAIRRKEIKETFFRILDRARDKGNDFLFIAGDIFENEFVTPSELREIAEALAAADPVKVIVVSGNHDPVVDEGGYGRMDLPSNVFFSKRAYERFSFDDKGTDIYAAGWSTRYIDEPLLEDIKVMDRSRINILVAHCDIYTAASRYLPADRVPLGEKGFDYIALGHIHKYDAISGNIVYPGSPEPLDFSESGRHGIVEGVIRKGGVKSSFVPFAKRGFRTVRFESSAEMTMKTIIERLKEALAVPEDIYRMVIEGVYNPDLEIDEAKIQKELSGSCFYAEVLNRAEEDIDIGSIMEENKDNIIGRFIEEIKRSGEGEAVMNEALRAGLRELLRYRRV